MSVDIRDLFIEIISFMGMREYDITPFMFLINNKMKNDRHIQLGELDKVEEIPVYTIMEFLNEYRWFNYGLDPKNFTEGKTAFSVPFTHTYNGVTTFVLISNDEKDTLTSKDRIKEHISSYLLPLVSHITNGLSYNVWDHNNKVSVIFVLSEGVSSYSKTFLDELDLIEIIKDVDIMTRCYDSCLQSNIRTIPLREKKDLLSEVGLNSSNIPSVTKKNDTLCKILGLKQGDLMISYRRNISSEETVTNAVFLRDIK